MPKGRPKFGRINGGGRRAVAKHRLLAQK